MVQSIGDLDTDGNRVAPRAQQADTVGAPITSPYEPETIAVVEDEYFTREGICDALRDAGWDVEAFSSCEDFLAVQESRPSPCVVLDIHFPGMDGLELLSRLSQMPNSPPVPVARMKSRRRVALRSRSSPISLAARGRSWIWCWRATPARISPLILALADGRWRTIALRS